jgi:cobalt-zinc-cadmium efflux system outer membrane protein
MKFQQLVATCVLTIAASRLAAAQQAVSRVEAIAAVVGRGPRVALARADSAAARAHLTIARQFENPVGSASYSKSVPQLHYVLDFPIDFPWLRWPRISGAMAGLGAARYRYVFEREAAAYEADTTYTRALAAAKRVALSTRSARDGDSLLVLARVRRDAGDGSELDVQLATVIAGQMVNAAARDSLESVAALLDLQSLMGIDAKAPALMLTDTLDIGDAVLNSGTGVQLLVAAAESDAQAAEYAVRLQKRTLFAPPSLSLGFESHDPTGAETGALPTIGITLPLPLFNQNRGAIGLAQAERDRAQAALALARIEGSAQLLRARRQLSAARDRAARSGRLQQSAERVAALSLLAFREGAAALPSVLEAQRASREALAQYVDDVAAARNAAGIVRLLTLTVDRIQP